MSIIHVRSDPKEQVQRQTSINNSKVSITNEGRLSRNVLNNENEQIKSQAVDKRRSFASSRGMSIDKFSSSKKQSFDNNEKLELQKSRDDTSSLKEKNVKHDRQLAGFWKQFFILSWKNLILSKRSVCGLITEIACPFAIVIILLLIRYFVDAIKYDDQTNKLYNVLDIFPYYNTTKLVLYYPNNTFIAGIVASAITLIKKRKPLFNPTVQASWVSDGTLLDNSTSTDLLGFISFPDSYTSSFPSDVKYTIYTPENVKYQYRVDMSFVNKLDYMFSRAPEFYCFSTQYFTLYSVFDGFKQSVDQSIISSMTGVPLSDPQMVKIQQYNCQGYLRDEIKARFSFFPPIIIAIAFLFTILVTVGNIVVEKQSKMKEYLKLIGIKWYIIWLTWLLRSLIIYTILSLMISSISMVPLPPRQNNGTLYTTRQLFTTTNFGIIFMTLIVYSVQVSMFTILISQIFSKPFIAKVVTILIWVATAINFFDSLPYSALKYIFCIFPNLGLIFGLQCIYQFERSGKTLGYQQLYDNIFSDTLNLGAVLASMFGSTLLYIPIAWYIERILPGDYGVPLPFYFPFMPSYWRSPKKVKSTTPMLQLQVQQTGFEKESEKLNATVCIQNISKEFRTGFQKKKVVNNMSLNFYENQVTGLLGHNGAGKTTTTFMLCGIYPPSSGTANILGYDIVNEMDKIRTSLGFCPQHDILYDELNVEEHLKLIALIKGFPKEELPKEIERISTFVGLFNDLKTRSKSLSGGMKRRLSVAMALIGDSKVIILDEPTSGLDPFNRRGLWELIRKYKQNHTIILTTHFMEEADALSDRIAIMNHGEVKCCGSPLFLKNLYGNGYRLTTSKSDNFNEIGLINLISKSIPDYKIETNIAGEITIALPYDAVEKLPNLLSQIEQQKQSLGISGYGISSSTIEEVFLKVGRIDKNGDSVDEDKEVKNLDTGENNLSNAFRTDLTQKTGCSLWMQQIGALFLKRLLIFTRRYILGILSLFLPLILMGIVCGIIPSGTNLVNSITGRSKATGSYNLNLLNYKPFTLPYAITGAVSTTSLENLFQSFYTTSNRPGITLEKLSNDTISDYVLQKRKDDIKNLVSNYYAGMSFNLVNSSHLYANAYYSTLAYHSPGSVLNEISNIILAYYNSNNLNKTITTYNSPISPNDTRSGNDFLDYLACIDSLPLSLLNFITSIIIGFCISFIVVHVGRERLNGSKSLQLLSGTHFVVYWIANHMFDLLVCLFNIASIVSIIKIVDLIRNDTSIETHAIADDSSIGYFFLLLLFSIFSWTSVAYVWSFLFKSEVIGFVVLAIILGMGAFLDMIWSFLELLIQTDASNNNSSSGSNLAKLIVAVRWLFTIIFPNVTIKRAMFDFKVRQNSFCVSALNSLIKTEYKEDEPVYSLNEPGIGIFLIVSVAQFFIYNFVLFMIEKRPRCRSCVNSKLTSSIAFENTNVAAALESDVGIEFKRIKDSNLKELSKQEPLIVNDIVMEFQKKKQKFVAVDHLGFGVQQKQCFGLLGLNGAGKTTTFKILTGEIDSTSGNAFINGYDINKNRFSARRNLGFCPQYDYLPEYLTVEQSLKLFAKLRGIDSTLISDTVNDMIKVFKLDEFRNKLVQDLSGGNKRKVNTVIAFLGRPSVVILDEPTTGVDPAAKRYLWTVINKARDLGMTIVLTSHSMEECEALCTKLGIMVNGQFQCLGNIQHLKNKYGRGYSLVVKTKHDNNLQVLIKRINDFLFKNIKGLEIKDQQQETIYYHIEVDSSQTNRQSLSELFALIEKNKANLCIETYAVSQTTLEDVFLSFARLQRGEKDDKNSKPNPFSDLTANN